MSHNAKEYEYFVWPWCSWELKYFFFFLNYAWQQNIKKRKISREETKRREKKTTATIENCMHIFCETLNDIHSSPTIDKYRAFFFVCPRKHWCRSRSKAFKYFPNDRTEWHTHTQVLHQSALARLCKTQTKCRSNQINKNSNGKKNTIYTKESESNTTQSNHKTIPFECFDAIRSNTQPQTRNGICSAGFWYVCASIRQY